MEYKRQACKYCDRDFIALDLVDGVCRDLFCQAQLHHSYGDDAFRAFCDRENQYPEDWTEFFEEKRLDAMDERIQINVQKARSAISALIEVFKDEHNIEDDYSTSGIISLRAIRAIQGDLGESLRVIERASKYKAKR